MESFIFCAVEIVIEVFNCIQREWLEGSSFSDIMRWKYNCKVKPVNNTMADLKKGKNIYFTDH